MRRKTQEGRKNSVVVVGKIGLDIKGRAVHCRNKNVRENCKSIGDIHLAMCNFTSSTAASNLISSERHSQTHLIRVKEGMIVY